MNQDISQEKGLTARLEAAIPRWRHRPDSEHEQAIIRLIVGLIASAYLLYAIILQGRNLFTEVSLYAILAFFACAGIIIVWLYFAPKISIPRRLFGAATDITGTTAGLYLNGDLAAPLFIVYLWVTFGNGFRFGKSYLYFSMILSIIGYSSVISISPHWYISSQVTYGLLVGLFVLPLYVAALLGRLTKTMDKLERANNAKSTFLAVMSHEIRTPLSGILGLISLLKKTHLSNKQSHYLQLIEKSSSWLNRVISDGLDYSKAEADELIIEMSPFSLKQVLADIVPLFQGVAEEKDIRFHSSIDTGLPDHVSGDKAKLTQVLTNLLANACKFTEKGEVQLLVELKHSDEANAVVNFTVSDTGIGMTKDEMQYVFQPFRQADSSTSRKFGGTGLGLTIADKIVRQMGGIIKVDSQKNNGATFKFTLTFPLADFLKSIEIEDEKTDQPPQWLRSPRVLLVEDNEINQEVLQQLLEVAGCKVAVSTDGAQAIQRIGNGEWDLVFMDCQMPVIDGYEATRQIRSKSLSQNRDVPIIALTAHVTVADKNRCFDAGMTDYLGKPCSLAEITLMLKKWLPYLLSGSNLVETVVPATQSSVPDETADLSIKKAECRQEAHELRNFFTKIIGSTELALIKFDSPEEVRKCLKTILEETTKESARMNKRN